MGITCIYCSFALILDMANDELIHSRTPEKQLLRRVTLYSFHDLLPQIKRTELDLIVKLGELTVLITVPG